MKTAWKRMGDREPEKTDKVQNLRNERPSAFEIKLGNLDLILKTIINN